MKSLMRSKGFIYANAVVFFFLLNAAATAFNCRWDWSRDRVNSLTGSTKAVIARMQNPVLVEAYITTDVPGELRSLLAPLVSQIEELSRVGGPGVTVRIINPDSEEKKAQAEARGVQGIPIEQQRVDEVSQRLGYFGVFIQVGDKTAVLPLVDDGRIIEDFEYRFLRELKAMIKKDGPSGLGYVKAPGTLEIRRWQSFRDLDKDNLFYFHSLLEKDFGSIAEVDLAKPVDSQVETLILTGMPALDDAQQYHLDQFIMRGGNLICMLKGFDFSLQEQDPQMARFGVGGQGRGFAAVNKEELERLNRITGRYGVRVRGEILFEPALAAPELDIQGQFLQKASNPSWAVYGRSSGNIEGESAVIRNTEQLVLPWFSGLEVDRARQPDVQFTGLVFTSPDAIAKETAPLGLREMAKIGQDPEDRPLDARIPVIVMAEGRFQSGLTDRDVPRGEDKSTFRAAQAGSTRSSIVFVGSPYMVSDVLYKNEPNQQILRVNLGFVVNLVEAAQGDQDLSEARARVPAIDFMRPLFRSESAQAAFEKLFAWVHVLFLPVLLAIYGTRRLRRRSRKRGSEDAR